MNILANHALCTGEKSLNSEVSIKVLESCYLSDYSQKNAIFSWLLKQHLHIMEIL